jgi:hypothetical protein
MIGASIYGFVDYEKTKNKKEFTNMYKETEVSEPAIVPDRKTATPVESKEIAIKEKSRVVKKQTKNDQSTVAKEKPIELSQPVVEEEKLISKEIKIGNKEVTVEPKKENVLDKVVKRQKRKLSTKLFSRGALDERYIKEEIKPDAQKTKNESAKVIKKER